MGRFDHPRKIERLDPRRDFRRIKHRVFTACVIAACAVALVAGNPRPWVPGAAFAAGAASQRPGGFAALDTAPAARAERIRAAANNFEVQPLADGVYAVVRKDPPGLMCDANCLLLVGDTDVVVVDAPESTPEVLAALRTLTRKPVSVVINTHWHDDHITGNQVYRDSFPGVEFIAHSSFREYLPTRGVEARRQMLAGAPAGAEYLRGLVANGRSLLGDSLTGEERESYLSDIRLVEHYLSVVPGTEYLLPTTVVDDSMVLHRGGREIRILGLGGGHTAGDLVVWLPRERILACGDLVGWPVPLVGADQSQVGEWSATLDRIGALKPALIVPGHGPVLHDLAYVRLMAALFRSVTRQVDSCVALGDSLEQVRAAVKLDEFRAAFTGGDRVRRVLFANDVAGPAVAAAYREARARR